MSSLLAEVEAFSEEVETPVAMLREKSPRAPRRLPKRKTRLQVVGKHLMHWIRRGHLYFGLFLFPWALLYGVTAFLFNHPLAFSDQKAISFTRNDYREASPAFLTPSALARIVIDNINATQKPVVPYELGHGEARFTREFAFASFKSETNNYSILVDLNNGSGTIREQAAPRNNTALGQSERAPFAIGEVAATPGGPPGGGRGGTGQRAGGERRGVGPGSRQPGIESELKSQVENAIPKICESAKLACTDVVITSIPELSFPIKVGEVDWIATYNPLSGTVSGRKQAEKGPSEMSFRRFLLRLHTAHGYPSSGGVRWAWAFIVDVMAAIMCFWGVSGILMWWQIKSTRAIGFATVTLGLIAAAGLGIGMHFAMR